MMYLYCYTNLINKMVYIGQTKNLKIRDNRHCIDRTMRVDHAIRKYGRDNFSLHIIMASNNYKTIHLAEIEWIKQARSKLGKHMVYNVADGGPLVWLGMKHSKLSREKMSASHKGMHSGSKNVMFSKTHSVSSKEKMSKNRKGKSCGSDRPNSKLTQEEVDLIRADNRAERVLAKIFNVSRSTINSIKRRISWK